MRLSICDECTRWNPHGSRPERSLDLADSRHSWARRRFVSSFPGFRCWEETDREDVNFVCSHVQHRIQSKMIRNLAHDVVRTTRQHEDAERFTKYLKLVNIMLCGDDERRKNCANNFDRVKLWISKHRIDYWNLFFKYIFSPLICATFHLVFMLLWYACHLFWW